MIVLQKNKNSMTRSIIGIIFISIMVIVCSCSEKGSVDEKKENVEPSGERIIRIVFNLPGDDIGLPEDRAILNKIITSIRSKDAGEILSSGFGMGSMEVNLRIKGDESLKIIKRIIIDIYPDANYRITKVLLPVS